MNRDDRSSTTARTSAAFRRRAVLALLLLPPTGCAPRGTVPPPPEAARGPYDVALVGGRVIDPANGIDGILTVAIRGDRIAAVTDRPVEAGKVIDASGLVVAPGFIDLLARYPNSAESGAFKVTDGVTTVVSMHGGPLDVDAWYAERVDSGAYINFGTTVGHSSLRRAAGVTNQYAAATEEQLEQMLRLARQALDRGAVGIGFGVQYVPGASRLEVLRLFELCAEHDVPCHLHMRYLGPAPANNNSIAAIEEVVAGAAVTGASVQIVHLGSMAGRSAETALWMLEGARSRGIDIMADAYPYTAGSTGLSSAVFDEGWQERMGGIGYADVELTRNGERLTAESFERYRAQDTVSVIVHFIPEEAVERLLAHPLVMVASDGVIRNGRGHPRGAGTFSRVLGRYVRERGVLTLPEAIRKMTVLPASRLERSVPAMARKGRLSPGSDADVVVFDPATVIDRATFTQPAQKSAGIRHVLVAGRLVVEDGELNPGVKPGRPVRRAGR